MTDLPRSYSTMEIAKRLGISLQTVQRWVDSGRLKAWKTPGGHRRIDALSAETVFAQYEDALSASSGDLADSNHAAAPVNVVIVEDNQHDRAIIVALAQWALPQAQLLVASNGFQGLVLIAKWTPQIVVTDIQMPHMDGFEMIRNVLADAYTRPQMLIAISAKSADELPEFEQLPTEVRFLQKPLDPDAFGRLLRQARPAPDATEASGIGHQADSARS